MQFFGYLIINTLFTVITAIMIYYFLKINFKLEVKRNSIILFVLSFGFVNGIVASLWTNLFKLSNDMLIFKQILLLVLSVLIIKFSLRVNWIKAPLAFVVLALSTGVGSALIPTIFHITLEEALSNLSTYLIVNIVIYVITILVLVIVQLLIKLVLIVIKKINNKHTPGC